MIARAESWSALRASFRWDLPARFNMGAALIDAHRADAIAVIQRLPDASLRRWTVGELRGQANRLANVLVTHGIARGDRVGVLLPQAPETVAAHIAIAKAGMVTVPMTAQFGADALAFRLGDCAARAVVTDAAGAAKLAALRDSLPALELVLSIDGAGEGGAVGYHALLERASDRFATVDTAADDPALLIYTSGTTGPPKGALHGHRVLAGHMPGNELLLGHFPQPGDVFWTPADWAWIGGLGSGVWPALHHNVPLVAWRMARFDPEEALAFMAEAGVTCGFVPPTALKTFRTVPDIARRFPHRLRVMFAGGEAFGAELTDWVRGALSPVLNQGFGQTEANLATINAAPGPEGPPGALGRAVPGRDVAILDAGGNRVAAGELGDICMAAPDPIHFLGYWNRPDATAGKYREGWDGRRWLVLGDTGRQDEEGWFWFVGRADDVIKTAGYRVGPGEIEDCLIAHPAVRMAAVVGVPDARTGERIKAFIILNDGVAPHADLTASIQTHVRTRLAAYQYPREVEYVAELPLTTTGKIQRKVLREREAAAPPSPTSPRA
ncbi:MAG: AMP-binding protein [Alphaproteobacteria bacterium]